MAKEKAIEYIYKCLKEVRILLDANNEGEDHHSVFASSHVPSGRLLHFLRVPAQIGNEWIRRFQDSFDEHHNISDQMRTYIGASSTLPFDLNDFSAVMSNTRAWLEQRQGVFNNQLDFLNGITVNYYGDIQDVIGEVVQERQEEFAAFLNDFNAEDMGGLTFSTDVMLHSNHIVREAAEKRYEEQIQQRDFLTSLQATASKAVQAGDDQESDYEVQQALYAEAQWVMNQRGDEAPTAGGSSGSAHNGSFVNEVNNEEVFSVSGHHFSGDSFVDG